MTDLHPRDLLALDALRRDRDECGEGLTLEEVAQVAGTRYPRAVIRRLNRGGYQVGEWRGRYQLGHAEPPVAASTGAPDTADGGEPPAAGSTRASGAPVDVAPRLFDPLLLEAA